MAIRQESANDSDKQSLTPIEQLLDACDHNDSISAQRTYSEYPRSSWTPDEVNKIIQQAVSKPKLHSLVEILVANHHSHLILKTQKKCVSRSITLATAPLFALVTKYFPKHLEQLNQKAMRMICDDDHMTVIAMECTEFRRRVVNKFNPNELRLAESTTTIFFDCVLMAYIRENVEINHEHVYPIAFSLLRSHSPIIGIFIQHTEDSCPYIARETYIKAIHMEGWDGFRWMYQQYPVDLTLDWVVGIVIDCILSYSTAYPIYRVEFEIFKICRDIPSVVPKLNSQVMDILVARIINESNSSTTNLALRKIFETGYRSKWPTIRRYQHRFLRFHYFVLRLIFLRGIVRRHLMNTGKIPMTIKV